MNHKILEALREHGGMYADEIAQIVGLDKSVIVDALRRLADNFDIYPEQVGCKAKIADGFWWRWGNENKIER